MRLGIFYDHLAEAAAQEHITMQEAAHLAADCGVTRLDADAAKWMAEPDFYPRAMGDSGITVGSLDLRVDLAHGEGSAEAEAVIRRAAEMGVENVLIIPGFVRPGEKAEDVMARIAAGLRPLAALGQTLGVNVLMEDYDSDDSPFSTGAQLAWFMANVPHLGCAFDTGNFRFSGDDVTAALPPLTPAIRQVHCKDRALTARPGETGRMSAAGEMLYAAPVGGGVIPMAALLRDIAASGFDGTLTMEFYGSPAMLADTKASAAFLKNLFPHRLQAKG